MKELNLEEYLDNIDEIVIKIKEYLETNKTIDDDNIRKIIIGNVKVKRKWYNKIEIFYRSLLWKNIKR